MTTENTARRFLRIKQEKEIVGLGTTSIYEKINAGTFPKPYPLGERAVAWLSDEIDAWVEARLIRN